MGKPTTAIKRKENFKSPISKGWISTFWPPSSFYVLDRNAGRSRRSNLPGNKACTDKSRLVVLLAFVLCGGVIFEILKLFF
jgi:hypothetical protein